MSESVDQIQHTIVQIQENIQDLDQKVEELSNAGKYEEADKFQKKIVLEKQKLTEKRKEQINIEQQEKQIQLQTAFTKKAMEFQNEWDERLKNFEINNSAQLEEMNNRHEKEKKDLKETLDEEPRVPYKPSNELITLRTTEKQLAKLKKFQEAMRTKATADQLEQTERSRFGKDADVRRESLIKVLEQQQSNERSVLTKKIERERKDLCQQRESENARLEGRYRILLRDQRNQQRQKSNEFEHNLLVVRHKEEGMYLTSTLPAPNRPLSTRPGSGTGRGSLGGTGSGGRTGSRPSSSSSPSSPNGSSSSRFFSSTGSSSHGSPNSQKGRPSTNGDKRT